MTKTNPKFSFFSLFCPCCFVFNAPTSCFWHRCNFDIETLSGVHISLILELGTNHNDKQPRLTGACAYAQPQLSIGYSHIQSIGVDQTSCLLCLRNYLSLCHMCHKRGISSGSTHQGITCVHSKYRMDQSDLTVPNLEYCLALTVFLLSCDSQCSVTLLHGAAWCHGMVDGV